MEIDRGVMLFVVGDIHGDIISLKELWRTFNFDKILSENNSDEIIVFLGDYVDRGTYSFETLITLLQVKASNPSNIILLRGNHEPPHDLIPYPHDLPYQLELRFGEKWHDIYMKIMELFQEMPHAALIRKELFLVHGGIPVNTTSIDEISAAHMLYPKENILEQLLWNDPDDYIGDYVISPRGAGYLFGINVTNNFLQEVGVKAIIRGHEPCEGFKLNHKGKVVTLFSRNGPPYMNMKRGVLRIRALDIDLSKILKGLTYF